MSPLHLAVIGAGIAGLACGTTLQQAGLTGTLFEKRRGVAGRMSNRGGDERARDCDHGEQYFTARHADFRTELRRWWQAGVAGLWTPRLQIIDERSSRAVESSLERFVGTPRMTAPGSVPADELALRRQRSVQQMQHDGDGWYLSTAEHGWLCERFTATPSPFLRRRPRPIWL